MPTDSNGMEDIYPRLAGGLYYAMDNNDPLKNKTFQLGGSVDKLLDKGSGWWTVDDPGQVRLSLKKFPEFEDSVGGCNLNFAEVEKKGYAYKKGDLRDVEVKMLVDVNSLDEHVLIGGPTGHHPSDSSPCCQGASYFARFKNTTPFRVQIGKEMFHHDGYESLEMKSGWYTTRLQNANIGIAYVRYNNTDTNGQKQVIIESWIDSNADGKGWKLFSKEVDYKGRGWYKSGRDGTECGGVKDQPIFWGNGRIRIRWDDDNSDVRFKSVHIHEIAPGAPVTQPGGQTGGGGGSTGGSGGGGSTGGTDVPTAPVKGFIQFRFRRHYNFFSGNYCAVANDPVTDPKIVYKQLSSNGVNGSDLDRDGYNAGETCKDKESNLYGIRVTAGTVYLTKIGNGGGGVTIRIKDSSNRTKSTLATIAASSINTTETAVAFTTSTTYVIKVGDRFAIQENGSPNSNNYIAVARRDSGDYDGNHSKRYTYYGSYKEKDGDLKAIIQGVDET